MSYFKHGLRGSALESLINVTNDVYISKKMAIIQKIPTPITPVNFDKQSRNITLAYFEQKSTVDYMGLVQGVPVAFDAKETGQKSLPLQNIHQHQIDFMQDFEDQGGVAFILVHFKAHDTYHLLPLYQLKIAFEISQKGGRKSIPYDDFDPALIVPMQGMYLNYLQALQVLLAQLDEENE